MRKTDGEADPLRDHRPSDGRTETQIETGRDSPSLTNNIGRQRKGKREKGVREAARELETGREKPKQRCNYEGTPILTTASAAALAALAACAFSSCACQFWQPLPVLYPKAQTLAVRGGHAQITSQYNTRAHLSTFLASAAAFCSAAFLAFQFAHSEQKQAKNTRGTHRESDGQQTRQQQQVQMGAKERHSSKERKKPVREPE